MEHQLDGGRGSGYWEGFKEPKAGVFSERGTRGTLGSNILVLGLDLGVLSRFCREWS